jgi:hypothetical protein
MMKCKACGSPKVCLAVVFWAEVALALAAGLAWAAFR